MFTCLLFVPAFLIWGCGGTYRASQLRSQPIEESEHVVYKNVTLKLSVAVMEDQGIRENGLLRVRAKVKNMLGKTINAEIKIKFLDSSGYEITDNSGWQPFPLEKGDIKAIDRFASSPNAVDYRILVKLAGDPD